MRRRYTVKKSVTEREKLLEDTSIQTRKFVGEGKKRQKQQNLHRGELIHKTNKCGRYIANKA